MQLWISIFVVKQKKKQENYNSAYKTIEMFGKFCVLLIYLSQLSHIIFLTHGIIAQS